MRTAPASALAALLLWGAPAVHAITVPGADGSDGALNITANTVIDLSQAVTGVWNANNSANAGRGIYDPDRWAVVFKYSNVSIAAGATVTFTNHPSRAPVVWLVSGNVTINGTLALDGQNHQPAPRLAEPGPGGFRGGPNLFSAGVPAGAGFGVGGGNFAGASGGYGGSYGSVGSGGPPTYGNPSLIPLIGGSGGGGGHNVIGNGPWAGGGGGGGAILVACENNFSLAGVLRANGGSGGGGFGGQGSATGGGSGGGIRIVCETLAGVGAVNALGGGGQPGGLGRIRIERAINTNTVTVVPDPSVIDLTPTSTALIWPPSGAPSVRIVSVGGVNAPADPRAEFGTVGADVALPSMSSTQVVVETTNVEQASQVRVRGTPRSAGGFSEVAATVSSTVSTSPLVLRWTATLPVAVGYSAVQVKVIRP